MTENHERLIAEVEGRQVTEDDLQRLLTLMGDQTKNFQGKDIDRLKDELVNQHLLYLDAVDSGLEQEEEFQKAFEESKRQFIQQYALRKLLSEVRIEEDDLKEYFQAHNDQYQALYRFNADHILLDDEEKALELKKRIDAGEDFSELARSQSRCPSAEQGGKLGDFQTGQMVKEFEQALLGLDVNEVSEPVKTQFGYHLIRLNAKQLLRGDDFESNRDLIANRFLVLKQQEHYANKMRELERKYTVKKYYGEEV